MDGPSVSKGADFPPRDQACQICRASVQNFGSARLFGDLDVRYFQCRECGFVQTERPHWLARAYSSAITKQDLGMVARNLEFADRTETVVRLCQDPDGSFLDFGGGYGLLVRLLRDRGLDFALHDPLCTNLFAGPAVIESLSDTRFEMITAFELLEHLEHPVPTMRELFDHTDTVLVSTVLLPEPAPSPGTWFYFGTEHGQHISLFSDRSLRVLAELLGTELHSNGRNLHMFTRKRDGAIRRRIAMSRWGRRIRRCLRRRTGLTPVDVERT